MFRRPGRGRVLLLVFLALSISLITVDYRQGSPVLDRAKEISAAVVAPIQRGFTAVFRPVGDFFSSLGDLGDLREKNDKLESEIEGLRSEVRQAATLEAENERLRDLAKLHESWRSMETVSAEVIARGVSNYKWAYVIDKGSDDGIEEDMTVIDPDGLVGKIIEVDASSATVLALIDPDAAVGARIERLRDTGTASGHGGSDELTMSYISGETTVRVGDIVATSGQDGLFPAGIPVGKVTRLGGQRAALSQEISLEPRVDFTALDFVQVLLETGPRLEGPRKNGKKDDAKLEATD